MIKPSIADLARIESLHTGEFVLPDLSCGEYVHIEATDDCRSAAFVKLTSEVTLILDPSMSNFQKAKRVREHFISVRKNLPTSDTHVFLLKGGDQFANQLIKHFGFSKAAGQSLYWSNYGKAADKTSHGCVE